MIRPSLRALIGVACLAAPLLAEAQPTDHSAAPVVRRIEIEGATVFTAEELARRHDLAEGAPLPRPPDDIAREIGDRYRHDGFSFAMATASLDEASGTLTIVVDEGRFDAVDVTGVSEGARRRVLDDLALVPGEVFETAQASKALDQALAFARGALDRAEPTFTIINDTGRRVLQIALRSRDHRNGAFLGTYGREDWYSPVDEVNLGFGVHGTLFNRTTFNQTYWNAYATRKSGPHRFGYAVGLERQFLPGGILQVGAGVHDLTASDDKWRLGDLEQSLVALAFRNTFRDYYRRKGYQLHAAVRPLREHELLIAWRDDDHAALRNETTFGFFRDDHDFRENAQAQPGDLRALVIAYTFATAGLDDRAPERFHRHALDNLFAERVDDDEGVRLEWRSELAGAFSDDFDFSRHIATARAWWRPTPRRTINGRLMAGISSGALPEQRVLALGGIGSVRGYSFKEAAGEGMLLLNGELRQGFGRGGFAGLAFLDAGRVFEARPGPGAPDARIPARWGGGSRDDWLTGVGVGFEIPGGTRVEFGWRIDDIPSSLQVLVRLRPTF